MLLDACVLLNLLAADSLEDVAQVIGSPLLIVEQVAAETLLLEDVVESQLRRTSVNLAKPIANGAILVVNLRAAELATFVDLARRVDDGEAATLAVAIARELPIATDDRKARRVAINEGLAPPARTSDLLRRWAETTQDDNLVRARLRAVQQRARFRPPTSDHNNEWWT